MKLIHKVLPHLLVCLALLTGVHASSQWNPDHSIGTVSGNYNFNYNQTPDQLVEIYPPLYSTGTTLTYQWEQSSTPVEADFTAITGSNSNPQLSSYTFSGPLAQTTYFRRKTSKSSTDYVYSNIIKIAVVSINWEDYNYIREHDVLKSGITDWKTVDQLAIGDKLQTTTYVDGLGRPLQKVSRETATPATSGGLWGDVVQFSTYDAYGRTPSQYLPYTTTTQSAKYKTTASTDQPQYYTNAYSESAAYSNTTYDISPLNRAVNVKSPGTSWAAGSGNSASYDFDDVGRLKTKHLDPGYTGSGKSELEALTYSYNIHNNITGINQDYAKKTSGKYDKWGNFFGLYLGYDNKDNVFNAGKLDGHVTGLLWNTMGDDAQRKYDYSYDNVGRITSAIFKERQTTGAAWDNSKMDFSVGGTGTGSTITYDLNGNLLSMLQKGVLPGSTSPATVDNLAYTYGSYSTMVR